MNLAGLTRRGRRTAAHLQTDTIRITAGGGYSPPDGQGVVTPGGGVVYAGPCRVKPISPRGIAGGGVDAGEARDAAMAYVVSLPLETPAGDDVEGDPNAVRPGQVGKVTASLLDPGLVGAVLRVSDRELGSQVTARRLWCELVERRQ